MKPLPKLMVAPNGARKTKADHPALPITLDEIVADAIACRDAGAGGLHLHLRDTEGGHILDAGLYREALVELRQAVPEMVLQITTEAVGLYTAEQQQNVVENVNPEAVSISLVEMLGGTDTSTAVAFYSRCAEADMAVQHILYAERDMKLMSDMFASSAIDPDAVQLLFVLGRYSQDQQSAPSDLTPFIQWMQSHCPSAEWAACAFGKHETKCLVAADREGGSVRVGFENSFFNDNGEVASSNAERVRELRQLMDHKKG